MSLESDLQSQYEELSQEIRKNIDEQDAKFIEMSQSNYGDDYEENRTDYQIEQKIEDLNNRRDSIWTYLKKQYDENTNERKTNFKVLSQKKRMLDKQENNIKKIKLLLEEANIKKNTNSRKMQHHKYISKRYDYYFFLYKIIALVLVLLMIFLALVLYGYFPGKMGLMVTGGVLLGLVIYIFYYTVIQNYNRDRFNWDTYYYRGGEGGEVTKERKCIPVVAAEEEELNTLKSNALAKLKNITSQNKGESN